MDALTLLLERRSVAALAAPAPAGDALDTIVRAALRVPDHKQLNPFAFLIAEGEGIARLGAMMQDAARASGRNEGDIARARELPARAPMVIVVVARVQEHPAVPELEQLLSAGCAVMAMQQAAVAQGFGGIWRSGWPMFDRNLHDALGLEAPDRIVGFLYLGTPTQAARAAPPVDPAPFVRRI